MTIKELIDRLKIYHEDTCIILSDGKGWSNIDKVVKDGSSVALVRERFPLFSDN